LNDSPVKPQNQQILTGFGKDFEKVVGGKWICGQYWYSVPNLRIASLQHGRLYDLLIPMSYASVSGGTNNSSGMMNELTFCHINIVRKG
jgi:hypothetical protein